MQVRTLQHHLIADKNSKQFAIQKWNGNLIINDFILIHVLCTENKKLCVNKK